MFFIVDSHIIWLSIWWLELIIFTLYLKWHDDEIKRYAISLSLLYFLSYFNSKSVPILLHFTSIKHQKCISLLKFKASKFFGSKSYNGTVLFTMQFNKIFIFSILYMLNVREIKETCQTAYVHYVISLVSFFSWHLSIFTIIKWWGVL